MMQPGTGSPAGRRRLGARLALVLALAMLALPAAAARITGALLDEGAGLRGGHGVPAALAAMAWEHRLLDALAAQSGIALSLLPVAPADPAATLRDGSLSFAFPMPAGAAGVALTSRP